MSVAAAPFFFSKPTVQTHSDYFNTFIQKRINAIARTIEFKFKKRLDSLETDLLKERTEKERLQQELQQSVRELRVMERERENREIERREREKQVKERRESDYREKELRESAIREKLEVQNREKDHRKPVNREKVFRQRENPENKILSQKESCHDNPGTATAGFSSPPASSLVSNETKKTPVSSSTSDPYLIPPILKIPELKL